MAEVLEESQPPQHDREAEMDVGGGGVDAELHAERPAPLELRAQVAGRDEVDGSGAEQLELAVDVHDRRP